MSQFPEETLSQFAAPDARPATFLERGVAVPFTTPMLLGARARPAQRSGIEFIIPNPAGVRGSYIVPPKALNEVFRPTLYDRALCDAIVDTPSVTPDSIMRIAREVASKGLAGRGAANAAAAAEREDKNNNLSVNYRFLLQLISETELPNEFAVSALRDDPTNVQKRGRRAIVRAASRLDIPADNIVHALEGLATIYAHIGLRGNPTRARYQTQISELEMLAGNIFSWSRSLVDEKDTKAALLVARSASLTVKCAHPIMQELIDLSDSTEQLALRWTQQSSQLLEIASRPAWLLDGWGTLIALWRNEGEARPIDTIREMSLMVPAVPAEVDAWQGGSREQFETIHQARKRFVFRLQEWRTGNKMELICRNEKLVQVGV